MSTDDYYNSKASEFFEETYNLDLSHIYLKFESRIPNGGMLMDAGCGSGRDSKHFLDQGYEVFSFDSSKSLCELASKHIGQEVHNLKFDQLNMENQFDGVWACASLLHLNEDDLLQALDKIYLSLKTDGSFYCSFKWGDFTGIRAGRFFNDMDPNKIRKLLEAKNFKIEEIWKTDDVRPEATVSWLNCLAKK